MIPSNRICPFCGKGDVYYINVFDRLENKENKEFFCNSCYQKFYEEDFSKNKIGTFAMLTESVNGVSELMLRREGRNKIIISCVKPLTDDQMRDLYWIALAMEKTGKNLKDLLSGSIEESSNG